LYYTDYHWFVVEMSRQIGQPMNLWFWIIWFQQDWKWMVNWKV